MNIIDQLINSFITSLNSTQLSKLSIRGLTIIVLLHIEGDMFFNRHKVRSIMEVEQTNKRSIKTQQQCRYP